MTTDDVDDLAGDDVRSSNDLDDHGTTEGGNEGRIGV